MAYTAKDAAGAVISFLSRLVGSDHLTAIELYNGNTAVAANNRLPVDAVGPLTDAQLRAAAIAITGALTDAQLRAAAVAVSGSVSLAASLPAGANNIGDVDVLSLPALPAGTNNIGDVDVLTLPLAATTTREHNPTGARRTSLAASNNVALPTLGASREIYVFASADCFVRTGDNAVTAADDGNSHPLVAGERFYFRVPVAHTHIAAIRATADGVVTIRSVNG
jgi:hypothetical protein